MAPETTPPGDPLPRSPRRTRSSGRTSGPRKWFSNHRPLHRWLGPQVYRTRYHARDYVRWLAELGLVDVVGRSKGVYPPLFHHLAAAPRRLIERAGRSLDGTWIADRLGYFFVLGGRKPA